MVQDPAQLAQDFLSNYELACARQESVPLPAVKMNLHKGILDFNGDCVKLIDWPPILNSISINKHLHHIAISSTHQTSVASGEAGKAERSRDVAETCVLVLRHCPWLQIEDTVGLSSRRGALLFVRKTWLSSCARPWESAWLFHPIWRRYSSMGFHWEKETSSP